MLLPNFLQERIDQIFEKTPPTTLRLARSSLSSSYREKNSSRSIFADPATRLAYLATRFPATYAAAFFVLSEILKRRPDIQIHTLLDLGSGPATATLAALHLFPQISKSFLVERSQEAIALGKQLFKESDLPLHEWICEDLKGMKEFPKADLAILSYSLGEIKSFATFINHLWQTDIDTIAIIEPGTPSGYQTILEARDIFLNHGAHILAPCPHAKPCPLKPSDWCHFSTRLERTKLHRLLKEGSLGFEDEKFSYLVVTKTKQDQPNFSRIIRHPFKGSGHVRLSLCTNEGNAEERTISRKDKSLYRLSRDAEWGDAWTKGLV
jgi:ribosomal protein RSM22 (predicted rRNA methylase)